MIVFHFTVKFPQQFIFGGKFPQKTIFFGRKIDLISKTKTIYLESIEGTRFGSTID